MSADAEVTIEWTIESYTRFRATVSKREWDEAVATDMGDEFLAEREEEPFEYDYGVTKRTAYIGDDEVL